MQFKEKGNKCLVLGSGAREYGIARWLKNSPFVSEVFISPGNAGTALFGTNVLFENYRQIALFAKREEIDLTVIGPENLLAAGVADIFSEYRLPVFGPTKKAARVESSKAFAKWLMKKHGIRTARFESFTDFVKALDYLRSQSFPVVIKASGLPVEKGFIFVKPRKKLKEHSKS